MASASEADETLRSIIDALPGHVFILDRDAGYVVSNQQALDYLGLTHEELGGQDVPLQVVHPDDIDRFIALRNQSFSAGTLFETEARVRGKDGQYRWFLVRIKPLRDVGGQIIRWYGIRTEIDARKRAEEAIRENEQELRTMIETIPAYVWTNLPDGSLDFVSQTWLDYVGLTRDQYLGWRWTEYVHPDDVDAVMANYREALATGRWPKDQEVRGRNGKGEYRWFLCRSRPSRGENGEIVRWYGTIVDIEDRKRAEEALRGTTDELQKLKDQLEKENLALKDEINEASMFEEIVGSSNALRRVLSMVSKVAPTESTVLVTGETGTGKELVARAIHKRSD
ncbi:MAG TPA: PAS domain-containing protein, partial [Thermoanaerobaculia bacterium]